VTSGTSCAWTAVSNASWITVTAGASGSGIGAVTLTVAATTTARTGTLTVAGRTVTVTEDAPTRPLPPTNLRIVRWGS
jgi:ABC-type molybdate transport system ATPase subunit